MIFSFLSNIFITLIYQPFFNLLVLVYYGLGFIPKIPHDMGISVIIFTIIFRILWLPISLSSGRNEKDKRKLAKKVKETRIKYAKNLVALKQEEKKLMKTNKGLVVATAINIGFQVLIALMLYRIFSTGLEGTDFNLLYSFIPSPSEPFNLIFLGKYDLSHPSISLNLIQTITIFLIEIMSVMFSALPATRKDLSTVFILPGLSYVFFSAMPAGKKLFVIVTLVFSMGLMLVKQIIYWYHTLSNKVENWVESKGRKPEETVQENGI